MGDYFENDKQIIENIIENMMHDVLKDAKDSSNILPVEELMHENMNNNLKQFVNETNLVSEDKSNESEDKSIESEDKSVIELCFNTSTFILINNAYYNIFNENANEDILNEYCKLYENGKFENKNIQNEMIIRIAYNKILKREPDKIGYDSYMSRIQNGLTYFQLSNILSNSQEYKMKNFCYFRFLNNFEISNENVNFYLFASGNHVDGKLDDFEIKDNSKIVFFKKTSNNVCNYLPENKIHYCFERARSTFFEDGGFRILNNKERYDLSDCKFLIDSFKKEDVDKTTEIFAEHNIDSNYIINLRKIGIKSYIAKYLGYECSHKNMRDPSIGFLAIIYLSNLYKNANFYLIGFDNILNSTVDSGHNFKWEHDYLEENFNNRIFYY